MAKSQHAKPGTLAEWFAADSDRTHDALAQQVGVSRAYISMLVAGRREPSLSVALTIADLTGVPVHSLKVAA
jgi:plasmid maintenance system antidote protein VapI